MTAFDPEASDSATKSATDPTKPPMTDATERDELDKMDDRDEIEAAPPGPYAARAGSYFRNVRYVIVLALLVVGGWFLYDGFVKWPAEQAKYRELAEGIKQANAIGDSSMAADLTEQQKQYDAHEGWDIPSNRVLGFLLPPVGIILLIYWLRMSRGEIRLDETDVLHIPGHPQVKADEVTEIDDELWDRKGISYIKYATAGGETGTVKLDDFVYERGPVDKIHDRLAYLLDQRQG